LTKGPKSNVAASVRQRLLTLAKSRGEELEFVLVLYAVERFLHRLSVSPHQSRFILKGAMLLLAWQGRPTRPTRDLDLLGSGEITQDSIRTMFTDICGVEVIDDGLRFDAGSIEVRPIREEQEYGGLRATFTASLGSAVIRCQVDVGTGDAITPGPETIEYPSLLAMPATTLRAYPKETVVAEKLEAMVKLGIANSRMKDFYDLWSLSKTFPFTADTLAKAIRATFERRKTPLPEATPLGLTPEFLTDRAKRTQWSAFVKRSKLAAPPTLEEAGLHIAAFLELPLRHARENSTTSAHWPAAGPWTDG
jgi:predicted nucleotidyltransferase component of viral defense system